MNGLPYYKAYPRDFIEGTIGMSFELKGAYRLVLDLIYMQGGNLPDDARYVSGLLGVSVRKWKDLREQLIAAGKLIVNGDYLTNERAIIELESSRSFQDKQRENRSRPNKINEIESPRSDHTEPDTEGRKEPNGSLSGPAVPTPTSKPVRKHEYSERFEVFWQGYPREPNMSKKEAWDVWKKTPDDEREAAIAALPAFTEYCRARPDYPVVHACRFLSKRRAEGFLAPVVKLIPDKPAGWPAHMPDPARVKAVWLGGEWPGAWGQRPGEPGCAIPESIQSEWITERDTRRQVA